MMKKIREELTMIQELTVKKIVEICEGELFCGEENLVCKTFSKDTREIKKEDTYIGIKGEKFDGNLLYKEAFSAGAIACILEKNSFQKEDFKDNKTIILVENTIEALKKLAVFKRENSHTYFVGVTGSVGKTSTRDMIFSALKENFSTLKTEGNYNNNIGLPLTLLRLQNEEVAVIEMGMNALGEIEYLSKITRPHISVITNVGTAHIGELGSRENILKAKLEIKLGMDKKGILVINNDNDLLHHYYEQNKDNIVTIGINNKSDFSAKDITLFEDHSEFTILYKNKATFINCPLPGTAFVYNSLVAFAVGTLLNVDSNLLKKGIENFELTKNRLEIFQMKEDITIINDTYNASVDSMKSSLEILKNKKGKRKIAILGSMLELGEFSKDLHEQVGNFVYENSIDVLLTIGKEAEYIAKKAESLGMKSQNIKIYQKNEEAISFLKENLKRQDVVLLKASNGMHLNEIVAFLKTM